MEKTCESVPEMVPHVPPSQGLALVDAKWNIRLPNSRQEDSTFRNDTALWFQRQKSNRFSEYTVVHKLFKWPFSIPICASRGIAIYTKGPHDPWRNGIVCLSVEFGKCIIFPVLLSIILGIQEDNVWAKDFENCKVLNKWKAVLLLSSQEFSYTSNAWWFSIISSPSSHFLFWKMVMN